MARPATSKKKHHDACEERCPEVTLVGELFRGGSEARPGEKKNNLELETVAAGSALPTVVSRLSESERRKEHSLRRSVLMCYIDMFFLVLQSHIGYSCSRGVPGVNELMLCGIYRRARVL